MNEIEKSENRLPLFSELFGEWPLSLNSFKRFENPFSDGFQEVGNGYALKITLPCSIKDSLEVTVEDGTLKITYNEKTENSLAQGSYTYSLPEDVDINTIDAKLDSNVLTVEISKKYSTKRIDVKVK